MSQSPPVKRGLLSFPRTYWVVIVMEFFERSAFFGMIAMLASYFTDNIGSATEWGAMRSVTYCLLYIIPILSGAVAEKLGYKTILGTSFIIMCIAYFAVANTTSFYPFASCMILLAVGGGMFKPVISGTIARSTDKGNSTMGFGIYYWCINLGSFIASLVAGYFVDVKNFYAIFMFSAVYVGLMFFNNLLFYKEPAKPDKIKTFADAGKGILLVISNWRFLILLLIFSGFWAMYNRSTDSALWLLKEDYIDMTPVNLFVTNLLSTCGIKYDFNFNVAHIMTINAGVIIIFQFLVSYLVRNAPALPTMIIGVGLASIFPLTVALSNNPWIFILGLVIFSIGEITAYPKLISYVGLIAPKDKVAIYMGFVFLPVCFASLIFDIPNGICWDRLVVEGKDITTYWYMVAAVGGLTMLALLAYHKIFGQKLAESIATDDSPSDKE